MSYLFEGDHHKQLVEILNRYRWQFEKGEAEFEGLDVNVLIETAVDRLITLQSQIDALEARYGKEGKMPQASFAHRVARGMVGDW